MRLNTIYFQQYISQHIARVTGRDTAVPGMAVGPPAMGSWSWAGLLVVVWLRQ